MTTVLDVNFLGGMVGGGEIVWNLPSLLAYTGPVTQPALPGSLAISTQLLPSSSLIWNVPDRMVSDPEVCSHHKREESHLSFAPRPVS